MDGIDICRRPARRLSPAEPVGVGAAVAARRHRGPTAMARPASRCGDRPRRHRRVRCRAPHVPQDT